MEYISQKRLSEIEDIFRNAPTPPWIIEMTNYYYEHGYYRAEDLQRLLGDPCESVEVGTVEKNIKNFKEKWLNTKKSQQSLCGATA